MSAAGWRNFSFFMQNCVSRQAEYTLLDLRGYVTSGYSQLWGMVDDVTGDPVGMLVTQILTYDSGLRACIVQACGTVGTNMTWAAMRNMIGTIESFAADNQCDVIRIMGRSGWERLFDDYDKAYVMIEKKLREIN